MNHATEHIETILKHTGFSTQRRLKIKRISGAFHEIDVFAKQNNKVIAVECKNYSRDRIVGIKEIRDF
jgi:Holliday junction resolvase